MESAICNSVGHEYDLFVIGVGLGGVRALIFEGIIDPPKAIKSPTVIST
jgi:hypothetical protein